MKQAPPPLFLGCNLISYTHKKKNYISSTITDLQAKIILDVKKLETMETENEYKTFEQN